MVIDTGAARTIVRPDIIGDWRIKSPAKRYVLTTANGQQLPVKGECELDIELGDVKFKHRALVADISDNVILGLDLLRAKGVNLDLNAGTLRIMGEEVVLTTTTENNAVRRLVVKEDVVLPGQTETLVATVMDGEMSCSVGVVEPSNPDLFNKSIVTGRTLIKPEKTTIVRVVNLKTFPQKITKGTEVGVCEPVTMVRTLKENNEMEKKPNKTSLPECLRDIVDRADRKSVV